MGGDKLPPILENIPHPFGCGVKISMKSKKYPANPIKSPRNPTNYAQMGIICDKIDDEVSTKIIIYGRISTKICSKLDILSKNSPKSHKSEKKEP